MSGILSHADRPAVAVGPDDLVFRAIELMVDKRVGAVLVLDGQRPIGVFSERDVMTRIVHPGRDPKAIAVRAVMTAPVLSIPISTTQEAALTLMRNRHIRHLPVVDADGFVLGMLSIRHLMQDQIDELRHDVDSMASYMAFDGASG